MNNIITLSNGKRVANFSSPHEFKFTDGSVLPAVSNEDSIRLSVLSNEKFHDDGDIELTFTIPDNIMDDIFYWESMKQEGLVDVVFCPLPMITALKAKGVNIKDTPFRTIRTEDRITKLVSIDKQCI